METLSPLTSWTGGLNTNYPNCVTLGKSLSFSEPWFFCLQSRGGIIPIPKTCCGDCKACEVPGSVPGTGSALSDDDQHGPLVLECCGLRDLQLGGRGGLCDFRRWH